MYPAFTTTKVTFHFNAQSLFSTNILPKAYESELSYSLIFHQISYSLPLSFSFPLSTQFAPPFKNASRCGNNCSSRSFSPAFFAFDFIVVCQAEEERRTERLRSLVARSVGRRQCAHSVSHASTRKRRCDSSHTLGPGVTHADAYNLCIGQIMFYDHFYLFSEFQCRFNRSVSQHRRSQLCLSKLFVSAQ